MTTAQDSQPRLGEGRPPDLFESKLHPPTAHAALISRAALVERLDTSDVPITVVAAPPGYGKTTLLAEWSRRDPSRFAWLSIDRYDNDLGRLMSYTAAALDRVDAVESELLRPGGRQSVATVASRLASAMSGMKEPVVLVLDHIEALQNDECLDTIAELALHLPAGSRLALGTRAEPSLPMARLRASGDVVEVGVDDLAMTGPEGRALLDAVGVQLTDAEMEQLLDRTEGWPVGLYLAALALKAGGSREHAGVPFTGDDRFMADYLRTELLERLSTAEVAFLTRTSVLGRMSGPLCDAVLEGAGSGAVLESLAHSNLLLVALDRHGEWYRYHHLFRDLLRAELQRREPVVVTALHVRAAEWYEANHMPEPAIDHAQMGDDVDRVNRLMLLNGQRAFAAGRRETVRRWLSWLDDEDLVEQYPAVAVLGALFYLNVGDAAAAERWAIAAEHPSPAPLPDGSDGYERASPDRVLPDGSTLASWRAVLRSFQCREGIEAMRRDVASAFDGLSAGSPMRCAVFVLSGHCFLLSGDGDRADSTFAQAVEVGMGTAAGPGLVIALAERGYCALGRGDWPAVESFVEEARSAVRQFGLDDYTESALAYTLAARAALQRGDVERARDDVTRAARSRPLLTYGRPTYSVRTLLEVARTYLGLEDTAGAREVLRQARDILQKRPDLGVLPEEVDRLESKLETMRTGKVGASSLTAAELRLVPFLPTHLTYPQVGARLHLSRNTVKSQAISIYQKLGVSSRDEAIERLHEVGLLDT